MIWVFLYVEYDKKDMHLQLNMKRFCTNIKTIGHYSAILFRSDPFMFLTSFRLVQDWGILCPTVNESSVPIVSVVNIRTNHKNCPMINDSNPSLCINWWSNNKFGASGGRLGLFRVLGFWIAMEKTYLHTYHFAKFCIVLIIWLLLLHRVEHAEFRTLKL